MIMLHWSANLSLVVLLLILSCLQGNTAGHDSITVEHLQFADGISLPLHLCLILSLGNRLCSSCIPYCMCVSLSSGSQHWIQMILLVTDLSLCWSSSVSFLMSVLIFRSLLLTLVLCSTEELILPQIWPMMFSCFLGTKTQCRQCIWCHFSMCLI